MPWVNSGNVNIPRGGNAIVSAGLPTPVPYIIEHSYSEPFPIAHWGTLFVEVTDFIASSNQVYTLLSLNLYRKRYRIDIPATTGGQCTVRVHITKKSAEQSYLCQSYRFTP